MYRSKKLPSRKGRQALQREIKTYTDLHTVQYCKALKRKVNLTKALECLESRHNAKTRLQYFFVALDILRRSRAVQQCYINGSTCYAILGQDAAGKTIEIHLREEMTSMHNRTLFFISCFPRD